MKKHYASILLTLVSLVSLGVGAEGQDRREVVVTVPYEFVAGGITLPAGAYTVSRINDQNAVLSISSYGSRSGAFVVASQFEYQPGENCRLVFEQVGDQHFLSKIQTLSGIYDLPVPRPATLMAGAKQHSDTPVSGTK